MAEVPRAVLIVVLVLFACVIDAVLFDPMNLPGSPPNLLLLIVAALALVLGQAGGAVPGCLAGHGAPAPNHPGPSITPRGCAPIRP